MGKLLRGEHREKQKSGIFLRQVFARRATKRCGTMKVLLMLVGWTLFWLTSARAELL
jgi:hypothetical protein